MPEGRRTPHRLLPAHRRLPLPDRRPSLRRTSQAVHFDLDSGTYDPADLERSLGALLPPDLAVSHVERAGEVDGAGRSWHAIFWATGKRYSYRLYAGPPGGRRSMPCLSAITPVAVTS